ncbi:hypothetical protein GQR58_000872 [Nymphon striatum]|nr:hypothetical protein GQR58_000872 [Nymphon striatum]
MPLSHQSFGGYDQGKLSTEAKPRLTLNKFHHFSFIMKRGRRSRRKEREEEETKKEKKKKKKDFPSSINNSSSRLCDERLGEYFTKSWKWRQASKKSSECVYVCVCVCDPYPHSSNTTDDLNRCALGVCGSITHPQCLSSDKYRNVNIKYRDVLITDRLWYYPLGYEISCQVVVRMMTVDIISYYIVCCSHKSCI